MSIYQKTFTTIPEVVAELRSLSAQICHPKDTYFASMVETIERDAARMEFLLSRFRIDQPKMDGSHSYQFRGHGWPMAQFKGPTIETVIDSVMAEVARESEDVK